MKRQIDVAGAVIVRDGLVLAAQRGLSGALPGLWEFPGGKIESGESAQEALRREIREELGCDVAVGDKVISTTHEYEFGVVTLTTFYCELITGEPARTEHADLRWLAPRALSSVEWAAADIPAVHLVEQREVVRVTGA